ncbi:MAG: hypothetical protein M1834_000592 [Cirrosporium novae-zelandiae]|nr:MAG: hypothetical protein M1834_000592 [Cirrosporium novae-zelandiae]
MVRESEEIQYRHVDPPRYNSPTMPAAESTYCSSRSRGHRYSRGIMDMHFPFFAGGTVIRSAGEGRSKKYEWVRPTRWRPRRSSPYRVVEIEEEISIRERETSPTFTPIPPPRPPSPPVRIQPIHIPRRRPSPGIIREPDIIHVVPPSPRPDCSRSRNRAISWERDRRKEAEARARKASQEATQAEVEAARASQQAASAEAEALRATKQASKAEAEARRADEQAKRAQSQTYRANKHAAAAEGDVARANRIRVQAEAETRRANAYAARAETDVQKAKREARQAESEARKARQEKLRAEEAKRSAEDEADRLRRLLNERHPAPRVGGFRHVVPERPMDETPLPPRRIFRRSPPIIHQDRGETVFARGERVIEKAFDNRLKEEQRHGWEEDEAWRQRNGIGLRRRNTVGEGRQERIIYDDEPRGRFRRWW